MRKPVHELHLPEHVGSVAGQDVHFQSHDLTRHPMLHLREEREKGKSEKALMQQLFLNQASSTLFLVLTLALQGCINASLEVGHETLAGQLRFPSFVFAAAIAMDMSGMLITDRERRAHPGLGRRVI